MSASVLTFSEIASRIGCTTEEAHSAFKTGIRKIRASRLSQARALAKQVADAYEQTQYHTSVKI